MKYVITGSLGNIGKPLTEKLLAAGNDVTVITSSASRLGEIQALGAKAAVGSVTDTNFLASTYKGADAVYTMVPPFFGAVDWKKYIASTGEGVAKAVAESGVKKVVNLSSIGAHMPEGCGPVSGLYYGEKALNDLQGVDVVHLRAGFFFSNFYGNIGMIRHMGIIGGNYGEGTKMILAHTNDIAAVAAEHLLNPSFSGKRYIYVVSDEVPTDQVALELGAAIGKNDLKWVNFTDEQTKGALLQAGLPEDVAANYAEMGKAIRTGTMAEDYNKTKHDLQKTRISDFAQEFAAAYKKS